MNEPRTLIIGQGIVQRKEEQGLETSGMRSPETAGMTEPLAEHREGLANKNHVSVPTGLTLPSLIGKSKVIKQLLLFPHCPQTSSTERRVLLCDHKEVMRKVKFRFGTLEAT